MPQTQLSTAEIVRRGKEIFDHDIRAQMRPEHQGKLLVIDVHSGDYEMNDDQVTALHRLKLRRPNALCYVHRIGARTAVKLGARRVLSST